MRAGPTYSFEFSNWARTAMTLDLAVLVLRVTVSLGSEARRLVGMRVQGRVLKVCVGCLLLCGWKTVSGGIILYERHHHPSMPDPV